MSDGYWVTKKDAAHDDDDPLLNIHPSFDTFRLSVCLIMRRNHP